MTPRPRPAAPTAGRRRRVRIAARDVVRVAPGTRSRRTRVGAAVVVGGLALLGALAGPVWPGAGVGDEAAAFAGSVAGYAGPVAVDVAPSTRAATGPVVVSAHEVAAAGLRPIPLPQLVPRDTVGPRFLTPEDRAAGLLALDVAPSASGVLDVVPGTSAAPGTVGVRSVRVEVERGLAVEGAAFAATVMATLNDPRGWGARGEVTFARTDGPADLRVVLASPTLVDALCAPLPTGGEVSCGRNGHAVLNFRRWVHATAEFTDVVRYREYLVNHEVGHLLGHPHERCPGAGRPAPLMQQQSLRVAPCVPNGWPYPVG